MDGVRRMIVMAFLNVSCYLVLNGMFFPLSLLWLYLSSCQQYGGNCFTVLGHAGITGFTTYLEGMNMDAREITASCSVPKNNSKAGRSQQI
jgi:hypothetical protein